MKNENKTNLLILGKGYVGDAVFMRFPSARSTRRDSFELSRRETWDPDILKVPPNGSVLWTFPAALNEQDEDNAIELFETFFKNAPIIIYGTTFSFVVREVDPWITENSELNLTQIRTRTEESLRTRGACILHLAGIFGPRRDPIQWYKRGLINDGLSYLNLIHLDDIVNITEKLLHVSTYKESIAGQRFNLSNGRPRTHLEIVDLLQAQGHLPQEFSLPKTRKVESKRIRNDKIKNFLSLDDKYFVDFP